MSAFTLRRLLPADAAAFRRLRLEALQLHPEAFCARHADEAAQPLSRFVERLAAGHVIGGWQDDRLAGMIGLSRGAAPRRQHVATLWGMYVQQAARGSGLAPALVQAAIAAAGDAASLRLSVLSGNPAALRLYRKAGFTDWATERDALRIDGRSLDEILMRLDR